MAKRKNSSNSGRKAANSQSIEVLKAFNQAPSTRTLKVGSSNDLTMLQVGSQVTAKANQFGSPSDKGSRSSSGTKSTSSWTGLLGSISTGGLSDLLGGGGLLSTGLDFLTNGFESLFDGGTESAVQPLNRITLPDAQDQTVYVNNAQTVSPPNSPSGLYDNPRSAQLSKADIVQTVKNALLTSSSLNDVIGEL